MPDQPRLQYPEAQVYANNLAARLSFAVKERPMHSTGGICGHAGLQQPRSGFGLGKSRAIMHRMLQNPVYPAFFREGGVYRLGYTRKGVRLADTIVVCGFNLYGDNYGTRKYYPSV